MKQFIFITILPLFSSCIFYSMAGSIPPHINSISIPMVENQTVEFGISEAVTDNLVNQFLETNILQIDEENNADSILKGKIIRVKDAPYTYTKEESVTEYRFTITMDLEWFDVAEDRVIIKSSFEIRLSDYQIKRPSLLAIRINDVITIEFYLVGRL